MRVLLVGPGVNRKYGDRFYYSSARRLLNGLVRSGHMVVHVSDRDLADYAFGWRRLGAAYARSRIEEMAAHIRPDLVVLMLADLVSAETIARVRRASPGCRVVWVDLDPLTEPRFAERFDRMARTCDVVYATTGGAALRAAAGERPAYFIPNMVDVSIDDGRADEAACTIDVFFAGQKGATGPQWSRALALQQARPDLRYSYWGCNKTGGLWGRTFVETLATSRVGLNLNLVEGGLYASDRMAQYLGNGVLVATDRASGYGAYFGDDEMVLFDDATDLAARLSDILADDVRRRAMARAGRARALDIMATERVAAFVAATAMGDSPPADWAFPV
jgi:hypothetical protein